MSLKQLTGNSLYIDSHTFETAIQMLKEEDRNMELEQTRQQVLGEILARFQLPNVELVRSQIFKRPNGDLVVLDTWKSSHTLYRSVYSIVPTQAIS